MTGGKYMASLGIRLSDEEKEALAEMAKQQDTTISHIVRRLIKGTMGDETSLRDISSGPPAAASRLAD